MRFMIVLCLVASVQATPQFSGDIRYRIDRADQEGTDARLRHRIRGRIEMKGKTTESLFYGFRLVSGDNGAPTSTNTTLDTGFSSKNIYFDRIFIKYNFFSDLNLIAGKMKNPFLRVGKNHMLFDGDLSPEGIALEYKKEIFFFQIGYFLLEERSTGSDTSMLGTQVGSKINLGLIKMKVGLGYYSYMALQGHKPIYDTTNSKGNTLNSAGNYAYDYDIAQAFVSAKYKLFEFFFDYIQNSAIGRDHTGWVVGTNYNTGKFVLFYNYRELKKDAAIGILVDSDFGGGGTDKKGHIVGMGYHFTNKSRISLTHFISETAISGGDNYHRTFLDYKMKF